VNAKNEGRKATIDRKAITVAFEDVGYPAFYLRSVWSTMGYMIGFLQV